MVTLPRTFQNAVQRSVKQMPRRITLPVNAPVQVQMSTRAKNANVSHHGTRLTMKQHYPILVQKVYNSNYMYMYHDFLFQ